MRVLPKRVRIRAASFAVVLVGCAGGGKGTSASNASAYEEGDDSGVDASSVGNTSEADHPQQSDGDVESGGGLPPDLGTCTSDVDCIAPSLGCYADGVCEGGQCVFEPREAGDPCDDGDDCSDPDFCDGQGVCIGQSVPCTAEHASGGSCSGGTCEGLTCDVGWGNCDDDWGNGCEATLSSAEHCGGCDTPCVAGPNASADCSTGTCQASCTAPWADCDGDIGNGCEIPDGVANTCDVNGLNMSGGCWTAHCGQSAVDGAVNFGSWYCFECTTCHEPAAGQWQWCNHQTGNWYSPESVDCGNFLDLAC
jgi:hypothetical protein